jgi:dTDP-4-dehydrorhamnose reductase
LQAEEQPLELWGGVECTVNRVADSYIEQLDRSRHPLRLDDFDRFAELGIITIRQPVLWERTAPSGVKEADWRWSDLALNRIRQLGMRPIVGLVHHGSGPKHISLIDPEFPEQLASYAAAVAQRYPWVEDYTPINEPLTTARFSGLYAHWYPHGRDDRTFVRALITQCRAIVLAMRAVRKFAPNARLIQTDDLGKVFSTPKLAHQAEFENQRRWLSWDLLCGTVGRCHPLWRYLVRNGVCEEELRVFEEQPCPPSIVGINHYLSGERFLDEHLDRYPSYTHGGNGRERYADVLAARVREHGAAGPLSLLLEAWNRYHLPLAVTECHNGCTREEQLRWFLEVWRAAEQARAQGADVRGVTAWSLLGAFDWNTLVTRANGWYEPGVFDIRSDVPRPTALAALIRQLAAGQRPFHPLLELPGWWKRPQRFVYGISIDESGQSQPAPLPNNSDYGHVRPVLITGGRGTLARAFAKICAARGIPYRLVTRSELDIADFESVRRGLGLWKPWAVINAAGYVRVDDAEHDQFRCYRENTQGACVLAAECSERKLRLVTFSSDLVFDGQSNHGYIEADPVGPLNHYGLSKSKAEDGILEVMPSALILRTSAFFGPWDEHNFVTIALRHLAAAQTFSAAADATVSPTYVPDLVNASLDLLIDGEAGIWHVANAGEISWAKLAEKAAALAGIQARTLRSCRLEDLRLPARRPLYSALRSQRGLLLPELDDALARYVADAQPLLRAELAA